jgi:glycine cleavage system H lipoate-binding protein
MLPGVYGFQWTLGQLIFLGVFYTVLVVIFTSVVMSVIRCRKDLREQKLDKIRWHDDFGRLPESVRRCRHELTGEVEYRVCPNEFYCRNCDKHAEFEAIRKLRAASKSEQNEQTILGFDMPADRFYHRGHTWVQPEGDGVYKVGLDDFGARLLGKPDDLELPSVGTHLHVNGKAWSIKKQNSEVRVLSPINGEVVETGAAEKGWYLRVKSTENGSATMHLLHGAEIQPWLLREIERLQLALTAEGASPALADGGLLIEDPAREMTGMDWDTVWGEVFLEP